ncbi:uncharacterized protein EV420DRAFT_1505929 [Desarmillaria tabescens]|uniref:RING-type domain-containing protein n=1 Tax=Armillaria tabescens TaxID=1929756 RepID=A0AA39NJN1_ARMTA|nr:uncharacterized protein EV420DRAFT_1505929 [Desarmillaria tabescens]KAK0466876.1 hypothetical protein EV420DRAFT_1505929 [Desarmillaria tabescens]
MAGSCPACQSEVKALFSLPCGHIYCKQCIDKTETLDSNQHREFTFNASRCPNSKCRKPFPRDPLEGNIQTVPRKFRPYLLPAVREILTDPDGSVKRENERLREVLECQQARGEYMMHMIREKDRQLHQLREMAVWRKLPLLHVSVYLLGCVFIAFIMILGLSQIISILPIHPSTCFRSTCF